MNLRLPPCEDGTLTAELPAPGVPQKYRGSISSLLLFIADTAGKRNTITEVGGRRTEGGGRNNTTITEAEGGEGSFKMREHL